MTIALLLVLVVIIVVSSLWRLGIKQQSLLSLGWGIIIGFSMDYVVRPFLLMLSPSIFSMYSPAGVYISGLLSQQALLLAILFIVSFTVSEVVAYSGQRSVRAFRVDPALLKGPYVWISWLFVCLGPVGMAGFLVTTGWHGTFLELVTGQARGHIMERLVGIGYWSGCVYLCLLGTILLAISFTNESLAGRRRSLARRLITAVPLATCCCVYTIWGNRSEVIVAVFARFAIWALVKQQARAAHGINKRRALRRRLFVVVAVAILIAGPLGVVLKGTGSKAPLEVLALAMSPWDAFELSTAAIENDAAAEPLHGRSYLEDIVYTYLPRAIFPWKPMRYGIVAVQDKVIPALTFSPGTYPPGILNEAYVNFGILGCVIVPIALALIANWFSTRIAAGSWFWLAAGCLLFPGAVIFRSFGSTLAEFLIDLLLFGFVFWAGRASYRNRALRIPRPKPKTFEQPRLSPDYYFMRR
jgi:oligosaccharide repeat unit polymerase